MLELFYRPFPPFFSGKLNIRPSFSTGLLVFSILFFVPPFGLDIYDVSKRAFTSAMYGTASFLVSLVFLIVLPFILPRFFDGLHWTAGKEILFFSILLVCVSMANAGINIWLQSVPFNVNK